MGIMNSFITKVVVSAIIKYNNKILLLRRNKDFNEINYGKGLWDLPGGKIEFGADLEESLMKEMIEEIGFYLPKGKLVHANSYLVTFDTDIVNRINLYYYFYIENRLPINLSQEHDKFEFFSKEKIDKLEMLPEVKKILYHFFK